MRGGGEGDELGPLLQFNPLWCAISSRGLVGLLCIYTLELNAQKFIYCSYFETCNVLSTLQYFVSRTQCSTKYP